MIVIRKIKEMRAWSAACRKKGQVVGLVPTMGAFHEGHLSLMRASRRMCDRTVVSLFVNPTQFGPREDLKKYPRSFARDRDHADREKVDVLFAPSRQEMYPDLPGTRIIPPGQLTACFEGKARPGHFTGVATVVGKLFNIVRPHHAFFGQKDAQQAAVVGRMVRDLNFDLVVHVCPIVREKDGLAMSSRNAFLSPGQRRVAAALFLTLKKLETEIRCGQKNVRRLGSLARYFLRTKKGAKLEYCSFVDPATFQDVRRIKGEILIVLTVKIGKVRLLDNMRMEVS